MFHLWRWSPSLCLVVVFITRSGLFDAAYSLRCAVIFYNSFIFQIKINNEHQWTLVVVGQLFVLLCENKPPQRWKTRKTKCSQQAETRISGKYLARISRLWSRHRQDIYSTQRCVFVCFSTDYESKEERRSAIACRSRSPIITKEDFDHRGKWNFPRGNLPSHVQTPISTPPPAPPASTSHVLDCMSSTVTEQV